MNWFELGMAFIAGGGTQAIFNYVQSIRSSKNDEFDKIVHALQEDNERLRKENKELHLEIDELRNKLKTLEDIVRGIQRNQNL